MAERLTDRRIAALKPSGKAGSDFYFDSELSGLVLRVYPSGKKAFCFDWRENGRQRRIVIGAPPAWTVGKARRHASQLRLKADVGVGIVPARGERVADLLGRWREVVRLTRRPNTVRGYERLIDAHILPAFGALAPQAISRNAVERWHGQLAQHIPIDANRALGVLSSFLSWLMRDRRIENNPAVGVRKRPENARHVFLTAAEIAAAHAALDHYPIRAPALALRLALLTGCRIGEALALAPEQIDADRSVWIKPAASTKQGKLHAAPLQPEALAVAQELIRTGAPGYDGVWYCWRKVRAAIGRNDVRVHDLRHSRASALARGGASLLQIGKVLGHSSHASSARYSHLVDSDLIDLVAKVK